MLQRPRGTRDFLPDEMESRRRLEGTFRDRARRWGYREIATPEFEHLELFTLRSGEGIVEEMYTFEDKGGRKLALRPEITASVLRMYVNEARVMAKPLRWFYFADCFRYERPQKGRYRQFWQFGAELIGADGPRADAEAILMAHDLLAAAKARFEIRVGHLAPVSSLLGDMDPADRKRVMAFLDKHDAAGLGAFLAEKDRGDLPDRLQALRGIRELPELWEIVGEIPEKARIQEMIQLLDAGGIRYSLDFGIARGLDYYTGMVFEGFGENLGAENQILGGGAYRLAHLFGGDDVASVGFAIGFDRVMVSLGEQPVDPGIRVAVLSTEDGRARAFAVARAFRDAGVITVLDLSERGISAQLSHAAKSAEFAVILGRREAEAGTVTLKDLRTGEQREVPLPEAVEGVRRSDTR
ncbi:MAG: histidine--tRNA ligase [Methanomicrobiales archaeon]|nr:histidine--tRNA ligase [Methanomicrobiales archaeon]